MSTPAAHMTGTETLPTAPSAKRAIVSGLLLCGVLDITAACVQVWVQFDMAPPRLLKGVASALLGASAISGGIEIAALGLLMHFIVATCATLLFYGLSRRIALLRAWPVWLVGALFGLLFFAIMNYATLPLLSVLRSLYLGTPPRFPGTMQWPQAVIHMFCVGLPIVWCVRRFGPR